MYLVPDIFLPMSDRLQTLRFYYFAFITVIPQFTFHRIFFLLVYNYTFFMTFFLTYHIWSSFSYAMKIFPVLVQWLAVFTLADDLHRAHTFIKMIHICYEYIEVQISIWLVYSFLWAWRWTRYLFFNTISSSLMEEGWKTIGMLFSFLIFFFFYFGCL